jgi:DNA-binding CsgD family transcriptional regulator
MRKCEPTPRLTRADCETLLNVTSLLYCCGEADALRRELLTSLQRLIPHDLGACHWMQPERHEIAAWYEPHRRSLPVALDEFWRLIQTHPLNSVLFTQPNRAWMLSDVMPLKLFRQTELYTRLYRPLGVDCELTAVLPDKQHDGKFFLISLHRRHQDFTERERALLNLLLPHIAKAQCHLAPQEPSNARGVNRSVTEEEFHDWLRRHTHWPLSRRESDVLFWLAQGKTNDEIGAILGIAGRTAETHALRMYPKIGVENRYGAITTVTELMVRNQCLPRAACVAAQSDRGPVRLLTSAPLR